MLSSQQSWRSCQINVLRKQLAGRVLQQERCLMLCEHTIRKPDIAIQNHPFWSRQAMFLGCGQNTGEAGSGFFIPLVLCIFLVKSYRINETKKHLKNILIPSWVHFLYSTPWKNIFFLNVTSHRETLSCIVNPTSFPVPTLPFACTVFIGSPAGSNDYNKIMMWHLFLLLHHLIKGVRKKKDSEPSNLEVFLLHLQA